MLFVPFSLAFAVLNAAEPVSAQSVRALQAKSSKDYGAKSSKIFKSPSSAKSAKTPDSKSSKSGGDIYVDGMCTEFCDEYFKRCNNYNMYVNPEEDLRRRLATTTLTEIPRINNLSYLFGSVEECQESCMLFPRPQDPATFHNLTAASGAYDFVFNSNLAGDSIHCRKKHLTLARDMNSAAFHCVHATNPAGLICRDSYVNGYTPYELLRDGLDTRKRMGYCDLAGEGTIAECTSTFIDDATLVSALKMLPSTTEIIFLNGNDITQLPAKIFHDNLANPKALQAIYVNDNFISSIDKDALYGLENLKIYQADSNQVAEIPEDFLKHTPNLLQFSMAANSASLTEVPAKLFSHTPNLERLLMDQNFGITGFSPGTFDGLTKLLMLSCVVCSLSNESFPDDLFKDLTSLKYFHFFANQFTTIEKRWFEGGWGKNIVSVAFWANSNLSSIEAGALDTLDSLELLYLHVTSLTYIDPEIVADKPNFSLLTLGLINDGPASLDFFKQHEHEAFTP